jgi:dTDP-4-amino-4,6-dideoxy-D-glucose acyltransferase
VISEKASVYGDVTVDSSSRVDDFCVLSGHIIIGRYVHLSCHASIIGDVVMEDFSALSGGVRVYAKSDDYSGEWMTNPTVPSHLTNVHSEPVRICKHAIIGANSVILPGVTIGEGAAVGANSVIRKDVEPWTIVVGTGKVIGERKKRCLELECEL